MKYRRLGKTGLQVSEISLGNWLTYGRFIDKETSFTIMDKAFELGINFFDCVNVDNEGNSEKIMGEILNRHPRDSFALTSKTGFSYPTNDGMINTTGLSRKNIYEQVHKLLKNLNMDYIDILSCHCFDNDSDLYETLRTLDDFLRQGKILYIGVSQWTASQIIEGLKVQDQYLLDRMVLNQPEYNLINRSIEKEIVPNCINNGIGIVPFSPIAQGFLSGKYRKGKEVPKDSRAANDKINKYISIYLTPENFDAIEKFIAFAQKKECTPAQLAVTWVLHKPGISSALIGANSILQLEENVKAVNIELTSEEIIEIENIFIKNIDKI